MAQNYHRNLNVKIKLKNKQEDEYTYDNYGCSEHIPYKWDSGTKIRIKS